LAKKSIKGALNLQDLQSLTIFIYIIYLYTILLRFRPPELKSIYLLWEHYTKSIAESSYSLSTGEGSWQSNVPPRRHPGTWSQSTTRLKFQHSSYVLMPIAPRLVMLLLIRLTLSYMEKMLKIVSCLVVRMEG
jgi:hypothetical protein